MSKKKPTYEEFREAVRQYFYSLNNGQDKEQTEKYFDGDEARETIDAGFKDASAEFDREYASREEILSAGGSAGAVAYNLFMLF